MCGITGFLMSHSRDAQTVGTDVVRMAQTLDHRGPNASGVWTDEAVALGHTRLSVLDLSPTGAQPMKSADGRYVVVFNGEIYNHLELRKDLQAGGHFGDWKGSSDTETLLAAVTHWGMDEALRKAAGMFAFAIWDREQQILSLARDRMGEKPLYWGWSGADIVFGSELKALRQHPEFQGGVCRAALAQYLQFGYVPAPYSIHPAVYKLEPGCILQIAGRHPTVAPAEPLRPGSTYGSLSIRRYFSLSEEIEQGSRNLFEDEGSAASAIEGALGDAVSRQMIADVPLGAFLSGGIDSSLIVSLMQQRSTKKVRTFTIGFEAEAYNEAPHAAAVARHIGTDHSEIMVTERETREVIPSLPNYYDEPFGDSSQIPTHLVSRAARSQVVVALTGDGGDELFGGYNRYFWGPKIWNKLAWLPAPVRRTLGKVIQAVPGTAWDRASGRLGVVQLGDKAYKLAARLETVRTLDDLYRSLVSVWPGPQMVPGLTDSPISVLDDPLPSALKDDAVARMMAQDMRSYLPDDILCKVDRAGMSVSLETRAPFLDPEVIAMATRLPTDMKIRAGQGKMMLRNILYRHVPQSLIERPKAGFSIPVGDWLRGPLREWAEELLSRERLENDGLIDPEPVRAIWTEHLSGKRDWSHRLWIVLMFQAWLTEQR